MSEFLKEILEHKKKTIEGKKHYYATLKKKLEGTKFNSYSLFKRQISKPGRIHLIAEIKKASPSKGLLTDHFDLLGTAGIYYENGASAISILTEEKYFLGNPAYLKKVGGEYQIPLLMKDFFIDEGQIFEAKHLGASAVLLIVRILTDVQIKQFLKTAAQLDLDCLVEVHNEIGRASCRERV